MKKIDHIGIAVKDLENSKIWICGIEYGISQEESDEYYKKTLKEQLSQKDPLYYRKGVFKWSDHIIYKYGWSMAKLVTSIITNDKNYNLGQQSKKLCDNNELPSIFKANLYPIAFNSTNHSLWHGKNLDLITGFENKYLYETWCFFNRLPVFSKLVKKHRPRLVIGTGVSYLHSFIAFARGFDSEDYDLKKGEIKTADGNNNKKRDYYFLDINHHDGQVTTLFVIPFLSGVYGLNSDHLLKEMGVVIRQTIPDLKAF